MGVYHNWVSIVRRKLGRSRPARTIIVLVDHKNSFVEQLEEEKRSILQETKEYHDDTVSKDLSEEDMAAIKIQSLFRRYLARRAFRALKSIVKLQALVRGVQARRQSRIALRCMHALVRLQVTIRARQLLGDK